MSKYINQLTDEEIEKEIAQIKSGLIKKYPTANFR